MKGADDLIHPILPLCPLPSALCPLPSVLPMGRGEALKFSSAGGILVISFVCGLLPLRFKKLGAKGQRYLSLGNIFAAGVFLGAGLLHIIPESAEVMEDIVDDLDGYPISFLLVSVGIMLILCIEEFVTWYTTRKPSGPSRIEMPSSKHFLHQPLLKSADLTEHREDEKVETGAPEGNRPRLFSVKSWTGDIGGLVQDDYTETLLHTTMVEALNPRAALVAHDILEEEIERLRADRAADDKAIKRSIPEEQEGQSEQVSDDTRRAMHDPPHETSGGHTHAAPSTAGISAYVIMMALSLHSCFEGLALGSQETSNKAMKVFIAIISHKWVESFALGSSIVSSGVTRKVLIRLISIFAIMTPLGIIIGAWVTESLEGKTNALVSGGLQSLAGGTFLYVPLVELIPHELASQKDRFLKVSLLLIGWAFMAAMAKVG